MKEILLIKNGELALKGLNRSNFEDALVRVLRKTLSPLGQLDIRKAQSTIFIEPLEEGFDFAEAMEDRFQAHLPMCSEMAVHSGEDAVGQGEAFL